MGIHRVDALIMENQRIKRKRNMTWQLGVVIGDTCSLQDLGFRNLSE